MPSYEVHVKGDDHGTLERVRMVLERAGMTTPGAVEQSRYGSSPVDTLYVTVEADTPEAAEARVAGHLPDGCYVAHVTEP
jgi:hypothetical protein